ncbi:tripartite tricarboxylate transporter substrate-binding protein [Pseudoroseomonas wenyumeiae]
MTSWNALVAPAKTPAPVIARLNTELNTVLADANTRKQLLEAGVEAHGGTPGSLGERLSTEAEKWAGVIEKAGIEKQ